MIYLINRPEETHHTLGHTDFLCRFIHCGTDNNTLKVFLTNWACHSTLFIHLQAQKQFQLCSPSGDCIRLKAFLKLTLEPYLQLLINARVVENVKTLVRPCNHLIWEECSFAYCALSKSDQLLNKTQCESVN